MASLTLAHLRGLASLYRNGVEGAEDSLLALATERTDEVARLLHLLPERLSRLEEHDDPANLLAGTIEAVPRLVRSRRDRAQCDAAASLAVRLAELAERRHGEGYALDVDLLREVLGLYPGRVITFGERGSVSAVKLRAILREVRNLHTTAALVTREHLVLSYQGDHCRGLIKLVLHPVILEHDTLLVPLGLVPPPQPPPTPCEAKVAVPEQIYSEPIGDPDVPHEGQLDPPMPVPPVRRPFLAALFEAADKLLARGVP